MFIVASKVCTSVKVFFSSSIMKYVKYSLQSLVNASEFFRKSVVSQYDIPLCSRMNGPFIRASCASVRRICPRVTRGPKTGWLRSVGSKSPQDLHWVLRCLWFYAPFGGADFKLSTVLILYFDRGLPQYGQTVCLYLGLL